MLLLLRAAACIHCNTIVSIVWLTCCICMQEAIIENKGSNSCWVRFSPILLLAMLDRKYGPLGDMAEEFWRQHGEKAHQNGVLIAPTSGTNYTRTACFSDRRRLALQLYFDAVVTSKNALGRAAVKSRKFYVFSLRICNIVYFMRDSDCIVPIAIVPAAAWKTSDGGFDSVIRTLSQDFEELHNGNYFF